MRLAKVFLGRNQGEVELDRAECLVERVVEERGVVWSWRKQAILDRLVCKRGFAPATNESSR